MELSTADLSKELTAIVSKVSQLEPEINRSAIDSSLSRKTVEEQAKQIAKLETEKESLLQILTEQNDEIKKQQLKDVEHSEHIDKLFRLMTEMQKRLDGESITNISYANYETVRESIKIVSEKLAGKGSVSYEEIVSSFTNTRFLAKAFQYMVWLFGSGGVIAAIFALTGIGGDSRITVQKLSNDLSTLQRDFNTNVEAFKSFKTEDYKEFKTKTSGDLKEVQATQNRQWEVLLKNGK